MNLYEAAKTKAYVGTRLPEEFGINVGVHQETALSPLSFSIVINVATMEIKVDTLQDLLHADNIVLISETMVGLQKNVILGKVHLCKGQIVNLVKA